MSLPSAVRNGAGQSPPLIECRLAVGLDVFDVGDDRKAGAVQVVQPIVAALAFVAGVFKRLAQPAGQLLQGYILAGDLLLGWESDPWLAAGRRLEARLP